MYFSFALLFLQKYLSEWGWEERWTQLRHERAPRQSKETQGRSSGQMQNSSILQQTDFKYIFCSDRSGAVMEERTQMKYQQLNGQIGWLNFHTKTTYSQSKRCLSSTIFVVLHTHPCFAFFVLHLEFSITLSRPFVLSLKWLIYTIWKAWIKKCAATFGSHFQPSWAAALLIARQILIYLWTDYLCMLVRMADAVIAPHSCGNN